MRSFAEEWNVAAAAAHEENQIRRERVLRYPDLAERLTEPPFAISDPHRWNGQVPPRTLPEDSCGPSCGLPRGCITTQHRVRINDSPIRAQLVEIAREALRRDTEPALDEIDPPNQEATDSDG